MSTQEFIRSIRTDSKEEYPMRMITDTIRLESPCTGFDYKVEYEIVISDGAIGSILITDKTRNGFKIRVNGGASKARIRFFVMEE